MRQINNSVSKGFDRIAFLYDALARIASFNQINKSQIAFLSYLSTQSTGLILGGGTGYFLQKLLGKNKTIHVTYVDASVKMIASAQKRIAKNLPNELHRVTFICKPVEDFTFENYDLIVCNYFLDLFDDTYVTSLVEKFNQYLNKEGMLYITDFSIPENGLMNLSTKTALRMLYWFFGSITSLSTQHLPNIESIALQQNFVVQQSTTFLKGVLTCSLYKREDRK